MSSNFIRKSVITVGALGTYVSAVYIATSYVNKPCPHCGEHHDEENRDQGNQTSFSYVTDPKRIQTFQRVAEAYDKEVGQDEFYMGMPILRRWLVNRHAYGRVMEVGAGTGRNIKYYTPTNEGGKIDSVVLTDTSDQMLLKAHQKIKSIKEDKANSIWTKIKQAMGMIHEDDNKEDTNFFSLFVADASKLTSFYPKNTFDTIVDTMGVCSFDNPTETLKELQRVVKPNGKILLLEHGRSQTWSFVNRYLDANKERHAKNWGCVWNRDIESIIHESGLEIESMFTWHFGTTYCVVCRPGKWKKEEESS